MHGERPMQVRRSKKFRTHEVTHSHFPMTLNKTGIKRCPHCGFMRKSQSCFENRAWIWHATLLLSLYQKGRVFDFHLCCTSLMVNGELQDDRHFKLLLGFFHDVFCLSGRGGVLALSAFCQTGQLHLPLLASSLHLKCWSVFTHIILLLR